MYFQYVKEPDQIITVDPSGSRTSEQNKDKGDPRTRIIDEAVKTEIGRLCSDNADFFMYKFNFSKKEKKRLKIIDEFFKDKITTKSFTENRLNRIFYFSGKQAVLDVIGYKLFSSNKVDKDLMNLLDKFKNKDLPTMPVGAKILIDKYGKITQDKKKATEVLIANF